jgi:hypothetical protein
MSPIDKLLDILQSAKPSGRNRWMAQCPAHEDKSPSLSIRQFDDDAVRVKCFAGCTTAEILASVGLNPSDLFPQNDLPKDYPFQRPHPKPIPYREILTNLREDLLALSIGFAQLKQGHMLKLEDLERLDTAALRCYAIATQSL